MSHRFTKTALALATTLTITLTAGFGAQAQVAGGSTTTDMAFTESTQLALGWSVRKTLLGKAVYNEAGQKIGKVQDLIVAPDKNVSFVIVGAGGFVGIGRHDVAIAVTQIQDQAGKLVMAGATKDTIKALPAFQYASDTTQRDRFVARAEEDIASGKTKMAALEKRAGTAATEMKAKIDVQVSALQVDVKSAEGKLVEMKQATVARWKDFEAGVSAATARLRKSVDAAAG